MQITARVDRWSTSSAPFHRRGDIQHIEITKPFTHCCAEMTDALSEGAVVFGENDHSLNRIGSFCVVRCFPWPEGASFHYFPIAFCPFCGERITVDLVEAEVR